MYRATTPIHTFTLPFDTSNCNQIEVTYKQEGIVLIKHYTGGVLPDGMTLNDKQIIIKLSQGETLRFKAGNPVYVQIRIATDSGDVYASRKFAIIVEDTQSEAIL